MKVLIIIPDFPENLGEIRGGVQSALANLLKGFAIVGLNARVITFSRAVEKEHKINYSATIEIVYYPESASFHLLNYMFRHSFLVKKQVKEYQPDLVHFAMGGICLATKIFGLNHTTQVVTIHGMSFLEARLIKNIREKMAILINELVENILIPNNIIHISNYSLNIKGVTNKLHYTIIPNAVKPEYFTVPVRQHTQNRLLYIGAIDQRKNILFLLKTMCGLIKNQKLFTLDILGDFLSEDYKDEVLTFVKNNNLALYVTFHGWVDQAEVMKVLADTDILVVCSKQETLPMVIVEGMAAAKVIVSADCGGVPEMINDGETGFLYNLTDEGKLESILENLYNNNELTSLMARNAKQKACETYDCEIVAKKTVSFYKTLIGGPKTDSLNKNIVVPNYKKMNSRLLKFYDKFCIMQWGIGFANGQIEQIIRSKTYSPTITWVPTDNNILSIADPFIFKSPDGSINLLYENFSMAKVGNYGKIDLIVMDQQFKPLINKRLLDIKSHLSYPFIFKENGKTYVVPESHQSNRVVAYEFDFENNTLINERVLIDHLPLIDSTILKYNNKYWLFATLGGSNNDHSKLYIFYADSLFGKYTPHAKNPVRDSLDGSRPAGNFIIVDGQIFRPAQNCAAFYGRSITINKVLVLTENDFAEEPYMDLDAQKGSFYDIGIHTINSTDDIIVVDGIRFVFMPFTKIYFSIVKLFRNLSKSAHANR